MTVANNVYNEMLTVIYLDLFNTKGISPYTSFSPKKYKLHLGF